MTACKHWFEGMVARSEAHCPFCEIETLRQRVMELEAEAKMPGKCARAMLPLLEELAALKQGQGEPLGYQRIFDAIAGATVAAASGNFVSVSVKAFIAGIGGEIYTAAPTIPALDEFLQKREQDSFSCKQLVADLRTLLATPSTRQA